MNRMHKRKSGLAGTPWLPASKTMLAVVAVTAFAAAQVVQADRIRASRIMRSGNLVMGELVIGD